ncbi:MAG: acetolactate synthase large subunit, partial [Deltaproteobacteria bacterium]|nr:acetolactate synthase large subunit [Deltaproteobacteria bacterium]
SGDAPAALLLGGAGLRARGLRAAARVAAASGAVLLSDTFISRVERGAGLPEVAKIPYFPEQANDLLSRFAHLVLVGTVEPVAFFGYPGQDGRVVPEGCALHALATPDEDVAAALEALAERLRGAAPVAAASASRPAAPQGALDPGSVGAALAAVQPDGAIVMDEAATTGFPYWVASSACPPHDYLGLTGGAIGQGLPCATGAAVACPDRPVIAFQADGSGMYTLQSLWTQAREGLDVTTVICANREYRILRVELARADISQPGPQAQSLTSLADPALDWVALAKGMGVPGAAVETAEDLVRELQRALAEPGPHLIEARI